MILKALCHIRKRWLGETIAVVLSIVYFEGLLLVFVPPIAELGKLLLQPKWSYFANPSFWVCWVLFILLYSGSLWVQLWVNRGLAFLRVNSSKPRAVAVHRESGECRQKDGRCTDEVAGLVLVIDGKDYHYCSVHLAQYLELHPGEAAAALASHLQNFATPRSGQLYPL